MNKYLSGKDLADFIKQRQVGQVRGLVQAHDIQPKLAIIVTVDNPAINIYVRMKQRYGADIGVDVEIHRVKQAEAKDLIERLNQDDSVHGIIVQLPLEDPSQTDAVVKLVVPEKDVDALGEAAKYQPATPMAILWLLAGYNIDINNGQKVVIVGCGKLVGAPLSKILQASNVDLQVVDSSTKDIASVTKDADIIISGTGQPGLITSDMIPSKCVVIDAGVASEGGEIHGDVDPTVYERRSDLKITPIKGGVGPLTVCALFENVLQAGQSQIS